MDFREDISTYFWAFPLPNELGRGRAFRSRNFLQKCAPTNAHIPNASFYGCEFNLAQNQNLKTTPQPKLKVLGPSPNSGIIAHFSKLEEIAQLAETPTLKRGIEILLAINSS